jgi:hypothetical protein
MSLFDGQPDVPRPARSRTGETVKSRPLPAERAERDASGPGTVSRAERRSYCAWRAHSGYLCPSGDSTFVPLLDKDVPFIFTK